jgi:hypothetical protein
MSTEMWLGGFTTEVGMAHHSVADPTAGDIQK